MRWSREDYLELMTFGRARRPMFVELFGPLTGLEEEWRARGASEDEISMEGFAWDYVPVADCGGNTGLMGGAKPRVLEETEDYTVSTDALGMRKKLYRKVATAALPLEYPVKNMDDWLKIKNLYEFHPGRVDAGSFEKAVKLREEGFLITAGMPGGFDLPRRLMGEEAACMAFYDMPGLIHDMLDTAGNTSFRVIEKITRSLTVDNLRVHEDMAGKSGPLVGPGIIREFISPYYRRVWELASSRGARLFSQDSDGNMNPVIESFLECGVNVMYPMEPAAGMDIVGVREKYGAGLAVKGGIDKYVLRKDRRAIRKELEYKMQKMMTEGGTVFGLDHRILNGTPLENYRYYVSTGREILGLPPPEEDEKGWGRMAF